MGTKWRKLKLALGMNLCVYTPRAQESSASSPSDALLWSPVTDRSPQDTASSYGLTFSKSLSWSSKKTCSICLSSMKNGDGQAIFTGECGHSFHFQCIASNVKYGNQVCPVCRAKWKEIPVHFPSLDLSPRTSPVIPVDWTQNFMTVIRRLPNNRHHPPPFLQAPEPALFNDDEALDHPLDSGDTSFSSLNSNDQRTLKVKTYPEVQAVLRFNSVTDFTVLINIKAPGPSHKENLCTRAPVDLVTVLDVSSSMAGTKLALLKRAMGFVIQNLGSNDRLSVIAFSSTARRLLPLIRMSEAGRQQALLAVNSLVANGGTNIAEGLRKGGQTMEERRDMNPVSSIILLSDGQDTYTVKTSSTRPKQPNYELLLPVSMHDENSLNFKIPVHAFGFGSDHDASSMHAIAEMSGGTFSFIETEGLIQDAFAQCIGGLLSVTVKNLHVSVECINPRVKLSSLKTGSYAHRVLSDGKTGTIDVGYLYADEERNFLVSVNVPIEDSKNKTKLLKVSCLYDDPLTKKPVTLLSDEVNITRIEVIGEERESMSVEVDKQRIRLRAADAMAKAQTAAENGDLVRATTILEHCRKSLAETVSAKCNDQLCVSLDTELKQMQDRLASRDVYETSGRAYILSGLSSHSWQRATTRGDSVDGSSGQLSYQTPSMVMMLGRSQATVLGCSSQIRPR